MQVFGTKMDNMVKAITIITHCAILPIPIYVCVQSGWVLALLNIALMGGLFGLVYLLRPFRYELADNKILIRKQLLPKTILLQDIKSFETIAYKDLKIRLRLWGSGGLWGWFGLFLSSEYGKINLQCTERDNLILFYTKQDQYFVLSPEDRASFIRQLERQLKSLK